MLESPSRRSAGSSLAECSFSLPKRLRDRPTERGVPDQPLYRVVRRHDHEAKRSGFMARTLFLAAVRISWPFQRNLVVPILMAHAFCASSTNTAIDATRLANPGDSSSSARGTAAERDTTA